MARHNEIGKIGEELAKEYLENKGYEILEQNYRTRYSEIDLIARNRGELIFIEVRTKIGENFGTPEDTLKDKKMKKMFFNAKSYAAFKRWKGPFRVDAICIVLENNHSVSRLNHYEGLA